MTNQSNNSAVVYAQSYGSVPLSNLGCVPFISDRAPTTSDVRGPAGPFKLGQTWINRINNNSYVLTSFSASLGTVTANWVATGGGTLELSTLTGDTGTATPAAGNIKIAGTASEITTAASGATVTLSLPSAITTPGSLTTTTSLAATTTVTAGTGLSVTTGNADVHTGNIIVYTGDILFNQVSHGTYYFTDGGIPAQITGEATSLLFKVGSSRDFEFQMGDNAGLNIFVLNDSDTLPVFTVNSNGTVTATGGITTTGGDLVASHSDAGTTVAVQVTNSDNTNIASHAQVQIAVGGTSGGNPSLLWQVSGAATDDWAAGPDRANSYRWCLSEGDVVGTGDVLRVAHTTGNVEVVSGSLTTTAGNIVINGAAKQLQVHGGAVTDFIGSATLASGTVTVANTNIAAGDVILLSRKSINGSTTLGFLTYSITAATSFTITSVQTASPGTTETADTSIVEYFIVRQV